MSELIEFLTSKEIIVVYIVAAIACTLCFIIYMIDKNYYKRKQKHNTKELNRLVEDVNEVLENETADSTEYQSPVMEPIEPETSDVYVAKVTSIETPIVTKEEVPTIKDVEIKTEPEPEDSIEIESLEEESDKVENLVLDTMIEPLQEETLDEVSVEELTSPVVENAQTISQDSNPKYIMEDTLTYTSAEPNKEEAQQELLRLTEELAKAEEEARNIDLTAYEVEQEENAIISLDELVRKSKELYESNESTQYADEGNEPISLADLEKRMNQVQKDLATMSIDAESPVIEEPVITELITDENQLNSPVEIEPTQMVLDDFNTIALQPVEPIKEPVEKPRPAAYVSVKKFERSPVISPIYGIERHESSEDIELENTASYEKLDEEIKKTNEFLTTLRELQKHLD